MRYAYCRYVTGESLVLTNSYTMLKHKSISQYKQYLSNIGTIDSLDTFIRTNDDISTNFEDPNEAKGLLFEILVEYFIKEFGGSNIVPIDKDTYNPNNPNDYGVDGFGSYNGTPAVVQCKYRSNRFNPESAITYSEISTFKNQALDEFDIDPKQFNKHAILITTANGWNDRVVKSGTIPPFLINYDDIKTIIGDTNSTFWLGFHKDIIDAINSVQLIPKITLHPHQVEAKDKLVEFYQNQTKKGIINIPSGGGKTVLIAETIIDYSKDIDTIVNIVVSPRISLTNQLANEIYKRYSEFKDWGHICYHSGDDVKLDDFVDSERLNIKASFNIDSLFDYKKSIIYTTYHSFGKLINELVSRDVKVGLVCCDEAHNLVSNEWNNYCNPNNIESTYPNKIVYFTATNKYTSSGCRGMNDERWFGKQLYTVEPKKLIDAGIILPPRLIAISVDSIKCDLSNMDNETSLKIIEETIYKYTNEFIHDDPCKIIITCQSADQAVYLCDANYDLINNLGYKKYIIISDPDKRGRHVPHVELNKFRQEVYRAIIFQYDMINEGIDVPNVNAVIVLRGLNDIKATQTIGRTLRLDRVDRGNLYSNTIKVGNFDGWHKPYGAILVPTHRGGQDTYWDSETMLQMGKIVRSIRTNGYDFNVEAGIIVDNPTGSNKDLDLDLYNEAEESKSKIAINEINLIAEDLEAITQNGFLLQKLWLSSNYGGPDIDKVASYGQILIGLQAYGRINKCSDLDKIKANIIVDNISFDQFFADQIDDISKRFNVTSILNDGKLHNLDWYLNDLLSLNSKSINDEYLNYSISRIASILTNYETSHYNIFKMVKEVCGNDLNKAGEPPTPSTIVNRMLDKIRPEVWTNKSSKILDPCCGSGSFLIGAYQRLMKGLSTEIENEQERSEWICCNMLYGNDISIRQVFLAKCILPGIDICDINIKRVDSLTWDTDMKFDVVIGNPPYNSKIKYTTPEGLGELGTKAASTIVYEAFCVQAVEQLIKPDGQVVMVFPDKWLQLITHSGFRNWCKFNRLNIIDLVEYVCWQNDTDTNTAIVYFGHNDGCILTGRHMDDNIDINITEQPIPVCYSNLAKSIWDKVTNYPYKIPFKSPKTANINQYSIGIHPIVSVGDIAGNSHSGKDGKRIRSTLLGSLGPPKLNSKFIIETDEYGRKVYEQWWYEPLPNFVMAIMYTDVHVSIHNLGKLPDIIKILDGRPYDRQFVYDTLGLTLEEVTYLEQKIDYLAGIDGVKNLKKIKK
jgi:superfamily II DNA or RNA helicase